MCTDHLLVIVRLEKFLDGHKLTRLAVPALSDLSVGPLSDLQRRAHSRNGKMAHTGVATVSLCNILTSNDRRRRAQAKHSNSGTTHPPIIHRLAVEGNKSF